MQAEFLDTNVYVNSLYDPHHARAVKTFLESYDNSEPLPSPLFREIDSIVLTLIQIFTEVRRLIKNKREIMPEIKELTNSQYRSFENLHCFLQNKTKNFSDVEKLDLILNSLINQLYSLSSWVDKINYYPSNETQEKKLFHKYKLKIGLLLKQKGCHLTDLRIIALINHISYKKNKKSLFITADKGILNNKKLIQDTFNNIKIYRVGEYLNYKKPTP